MYYLWESFSGWHIAGLTCTMTVYVVCFSLFYASAKAKYDDKNPEKLISGGTKLFEPGGVLEYTWDMLFVTMFVQLATGFLSDVFWLVHLIPPSIGFYYLWIKVIYPWISKPDPEAAPMPDQQGQGRTKVKYGKAH